MLFATKMPFVFTYFALFEMASCANALFETKITLYQTPL